MGCHALILVILNPHEYDVNTQLVNASRGDDERDRPLPEQRHQFLKHEYFSSKANGSRSHEREPLSWIGLYN